MRIPPFALLAAAPLLLAAVHAAAQQAPDPRAVQPERPTVATHAGSVAPGYVELETGLEADRFAGGGRQLGTPSVLKVGLAPRVQLNVGTAWIRSSGAGVEAVSGIGDLNVGVKWRVLENAPVLGDFAVLPGIKLPTGSLRRGTGTGTTDATLLLISSHELPGGVAMDLNAGYARRGGDGTDAPKSATLWAASFGGTLQGPLGMVAELFGQPGTSGPAGAAPTVAVLTGPTLLVRPWMAVDAGVIRRLQGPQPNAVYVGLVYNLGRIPTGRPGRAAASAAAFR